MKLLLVEDDREAGAYLERAFGQAGHTVDHAKAGREGLLLAAGETYDVIVLDRMLPEVDGMTILRTIRASNIQTPVLLLTAMDGIDDRVEGLEAGAHDYLVKPFAFAELLARLNALGTTVATADAEPSMTAAPASAATASHRVRRNLRRGMEPPNRSCMCPPQDLDVMQTCRGCGNGTYRPLSL